MRLALYLIVSVGPACVFVYLFGCWLLGVWPWEWMREHTPEQYDGKEPYDVWAGKMERGRRLQQQEEARDE